VHNNGSNLSLSAVCVAVVVVYIFVLDVTPTILFTFYSHIAIQFVALRAVLWCMDLCASECRVLSVHNGEHDGPPSSVTSANRYDFVHY